MESKDEKKHPNASTIPPRPRVATFASAVGPRTIGQPGRLTSLRPTPDLSLGSAKKKQFFPKVPTTPIDVDNENSQDNNNNAVDTSIVKKEKEESSWSTAIAEHLHKMSKESQKQERLRQKQLEKDKLRKEKFQKQTQQNANSTISPFGVGPPSGKGKSKAKSAPEGAKLDLEESKKEAQEMEENEVAIDTEDPYHPLSVPLEPPQDWQVEIKQDPELNMPVRKFKVPEDESEFMQQNELCLLQLPTALPLIAQKKKTPSKKKDKDGKQEETSKDEKKKKTAQTVEVEDSLFGLPHEFTNTTTDIPSGPIGKLLIFKSGKMKLRIGDHLFDVSRGEECGFLQQVAAISPATKQFHELSHLSKKFNCTLDVDSLLENQ